MHRLFLFLLLLLPTLPLRAYQQHDISSPFYLGNVPSWVKECACPLEPIPLKPSQVNLQFLLSDTQRNWPDNSLYVHYAIKPLTIHGASNVAKVQIEFCPSYQNAVVHMIRVYRDGKWSDRLHQARHSLLQRESELEADLYHGIFTLVYFLHDVHVGDIVECAYTIEGALPHFSSHLTNGFSLQGPVVFEHLYRRLLASATSDIDCKLFNTTEEPAIADLSPSLREWSWELEETEPAQFEEDAPQWHMPIAWVQFSEYKSWSEVIEKLLPLYTLEEDFFNHLPYEMAATVQKWMDLSSDPHERAMQALRFVQERVRYLGFEEGIDGLKPHDPRDVFLQHFGDCKDKTFLLHALLQCMGIHSTPVLVSMDDGKFLPESIPLPFAFDHIILRIEIDGEEYWVDSTITLQGGTSLRDNFCPIYYWGLPISRFETGLVEISGNFEDKPTLIDTSFKLISEKEAALKIVRTFEGHKADAMRRFLNVVGIYNYTCDFCDTLQRSYGHALIEKDPVLYDDRDNNVLTIAQYYLVPTDIRGEKIALKTFSMALLNYLQNDLNPERNAPYALTYPLWVKERLHVETPYVQWEHDSDAYEIEHACLFYSYISERDGSCSDAYFELKHLMDHVPKEQMRKYWEVTNEIEQDAFFNFYVADAEEDAA